MHPKYAHKIKYPLESFYLVIMSVQQQDIPRQVSRNTRDDNSPADPNLDTDQGKK